MEILDRMFEELKKIVNDNKGSHQITEFACHKIKKGILTPVYKNDTDTIGLKAWKDFHAKTNMVVAENDLLEEIRQIKRSIAVNNVDDEGRNYSCFISFNIKSIFVIPIMEDNTVIAYIVIPSLREYYDFTNYKVAKCIEIVAKYNDEIVSSGILGEYDI